MKKILLIIAMITCYAMIFIDQSGIAVILPRLQQDLSLSANLIHWGVNAYILTIALLMLLGGKLADLYGYRKIFIWGLWAFILASVVCGIAHSGFILLVGRILQGVGASLLVPCIAVLIHQNFSEKDFGKAFGTILAFANFFFAMGPFIGGVLTEFVSWRFFFWINIPIGLVCIYLTFKTVQKDLLTHDRRFSDTSGLLTYMVTLGALVVALMQAVSLGWMNTGILILWIVAIVGLIALIRIELKAKEPILDIRLFYQKTFSASSVILFCATACLASMVFWALWLQLSLGFSPATVGLALLPATVTYIFMPPLGGAWLDKKGPRPPLLLGTFLILLGMVWIAVTALTQKYEWILLGLFAIGFGIPLAIPSSITTMVSSVKPESRGMASGIYGVIMQVATAIGFAIMTAIISGYNNKHLESVLHSYPGVTSHQVSILLTGKNIIPQLSNEQMVMLKNTAASIYTHAFSYGMMTIALFALMGLLSVFFIKKTNA